MLKKEYLIYKLSEAAREACKIDNELFPMYNVKRGLRNEDGSGVLVGLTQVGNVVGYERLPEGGLKAIPGKLFYRGYDVEDLAHDFIKEKRFGFEEVAYLLLSGKLPDKEELSAFKELLNDNMPLEQKTKMNILDLEGQNIMNMGFEGIDWKRDENGNYVSLLDPSIQGSATSVLGGKYPSKESSFGGLILPDDFSLVSPNYNHEIQNTVRNFYKLREELSDETTLLPREYEYEFLSSREKSQATMDLGDEYAKLVLKDGDLEDNWNTWVEEKMAVVQPVLDQLNK